MCILYRHWFACSSLRSDYAKREHCDLSHIIQLRSFTIFDVPGIKVSIDCVVLRAPFNGFFPHFRWTRFACDCRRAKNTEHTSSNIRNRFVHVSRCSFYRKDAANAMQSIFFHSPILCDLKLRYIGTCEEDGAIADDGKSGRRDTFRFEWMKRTRKWRVGAIMHSRFSVENKYIFLGSGTMRSLLSSWLAHRLKSPNYFPN